MMSTPNPEAHTLIGAYVVDGLDDLERRQFERHLAECTACTAEVQELREVVGVFATSVAEAPPEHLKAQVLAKTAGTRRVPPVIGAQADRAKSVTVRRVLVPVAAAALVVATVSGVVFGYRANTTNADLNQQLQVLKQTEGNYNELAALMGRPDAKVVRQEVPGGAATVVYSPSAHVAAMLGSDMPTAPDQRAYQGWLIRDDQPKSVGLSPGGTRGGAMLAHDVAPGDRLAVTVEPTGGSAQPTTPPVATVTLA